MRAAGAARLVAAAAYLLGRGGQGQAEEGMEEPRRKDAEEVAPAEPHASQRQGGRGEVPGRVRHACRDGVQQTDGLERLSARPARGEGEE